MPDEPSQIPVPHAERDLLALHALRQRQLRTVFLHGRRRTWRDRRRIWPAVVIGAVIVAVLLAGLSVLAAFQHQQRIDSDPAGEAPTAASLRHAMGPFGERVEGVCDATCGLTSVTPSPN